MSFPFRAAAVLFSLLLHSSIAAVGIFFTGSAAPPEEIVYQVSLTEFAPASPGRPVQEALPQAKPEAAPAQPQPEPKPEPAPLLSEPAPVPAPPPPKQLPRPQPERSRPKAVERKPQQTVPQSAQTDAQQATAPQGLTGETAGETPRIIGGMSAYTEEAVEQRPSISRRVTPEYPEHARRRKIQGEVIVRLVVDTSGVSQQCAILSSSPEGVFDNAALAAARKTRFIPGKVKGRPVNTIVLIPYKFTLR